MTADLPLFEINPAPARRLMRITMRGFWTKQTIEEYDGALVAAGRSMEAGGCAISDILVLVDARELDIQTQPLIADYQRRFSVPDRQPKRIATIMSKALQKMQAQRVAFPNQRIFTDEGEAVCWLNDELPS